LGLLIALSQGNNCFAQFGGIGDAIKKAGGDIAREGKKAGGDISREGKKAGGDISREGKKAINDAGQAIEKPFRHAADNAKEAVFFGMRNHVIGKNNDLGIRGRRFGRGHKYYDLIQPHLPNGIDFSQISFFFDAYVPSGMAGITFDEYVYINLPYRDFDPQYLELLAHETGHVIQYKRWSTKGFARKYCDDVFGSWTKYPNFDQVKIHDDMEIEREADAFSAKVVAAFYQRMNGQGNNQPIPQNPSIPGQPFPGQNVQPNGISPNPQGFPNGNQQMSDGEKIAGIILQGIGNAIDERQRREQEMRMRPQLPNQNAPQPRLGINLQLVPGRGGLVTSVSPGMPAANAGIEVNDIVVSIDGRRVQSSNDVLSILRNAASNGRRNAKVLVENHRLNHMPLEQRYQEVEVNW
jgi:hypothetical protein